MNASKIKGSFLEYIVRRILSNCGFTLVKPDGLLIFSRGGLTMINGKGAAHDADVLMTPPIQMPFSYPYRLNFECKAYNNTTGLPVIRNALGLRYDINEFEIVTRNHLLNRQNNRRSSLALDNRQRFNYQVGVASIEGFSKPAFEFAANNKIPLISLRWFLPGNVCDSFHEITKDYLEQFEEQQLNDLHLLLKGNQNANGERFIRDTDSIFRNIFRSIREFEKRVLIGLSESGDLLFLFANENSDRQILLDGNTVMDARFSYSRNEPDHWTLTVDQGIQLDFRLPEGIIEMWANQGYDEGAAIDIKEEIFSRIFIFVENESLPFRILTIDRKWLSEIRFDE